MRALDRMFGVAANPMRNLGALGYLFFWVLAATGIYLYVFFDTSVAGAYDSIGRLSRDQWWLGGVLRSVHRYAADGLVAVSFGHLVREWALGRYRRSRAFLWVSGVPLMWLLYASGMIGYWLVWDARAQFSALATAEWLDGLRIGAEPMARNILGAEAAADRVFSLFVFLHIGVPLLLLGGMWVHVQRMGRPRTVAPRALVLGTLATLAVAALALPVGSEAPADPSRLPSSIDFDWYVLFVHPLMYATSPAMLWTLVGAATFGLCIMPWVSHEHSQESGTKKTPGRRWPSRAAAPYYRVGVYAAFGGALALFSHRPAYAPLPPGDAMLQLSIAHPGARLEPCRERSASELARLPPNMRAPLDCPRGRSPVRVTVTLDGRLLVDETVAPSGIARDGASTLYRRIPVPAGAHRLRVTVDDDLRRPGQAERDAAIDLAVGRVLSIDYRPHQGGIVLS
ncbi:MAG TPA: cytochrome b N-terminal domain-containing protein [Burkholderiales bacterium]|nr:cytochrome b N-terminal domain-containing protein [Burkholderiales bacterium]